MNDRTRYLNVRNTLLALFQYGALPIINENDTVRVDELQRNVGDNDRLAAMVTNLLTAPLLVLLSDVEGLYDRHPSDPGAAVIPLVQQLDVTLANFQRQSPASKGANSLSRGGMASKLEAARLAVSAGENVIIANGRRPNVLVDIVGGETVGTLFWLRVPRWPPANAGSGSRRNPMVGLFLMPAPKKRSSKMGRSLLAIGVTRLEGNFQKGDVISLCRERGRSLVADCLIMALRSYAAFPDKPRNAS